MSLQPWTVIPLLDYEPNNPISVQGMKREGGRQKGYTKRGKSNLGICQVIPIRFVPDDNLFSRFFVATPLTWFSFALSSQMSQKNQIRTTHFNSFLSNGGRWRPMFTFFFRGFWLMIKNKPRSKLRFPEFDLEPWQFVTHRMKAIEIIDFLVQ